MNYLNCCNDDYLQHYGVPGMKWGVRRRTQLPTSNIRNRYDAAKANYKSAKKVYKKSFNEAYDKSMAAWSPSKKHRQENDARWEKAIKDADKANKAQNSYKKAKQERKYAINKTYADINKKASFGERFIYNDATRKKAAKYIVDNNMSVADANKRAKKDAWVNSAIIGGAIGAISVASLYKR